MEVDGRDTTSWAPPANEHGIREFMVAGSEGPLVSVDLGATPAVPTDVKTVAPAVPDTTHVAHTPHRCALPHHRWLLLDEGECGCVRGRSAGQGAAFAAAGTGAGSGAVNAGSGAGSSGAGGAATTLGPRRGRFTRGLAGAAVGGGAGASAASSGSGGSSSSGSGSWNCTSTAAGASAPRSDASSDFSSTGATGSSRTGTSSTTGGSGSRTEAGTSSTTGTGIGGRRAVSQARSDCSASITSPRCRRPTHRKAVALDDLQVGQLNVVAGNHAANLPPPRRHGCSGNGRAAQTRSPSYSTAACPGAMPRAGDAISAPPVTPSATTQPGAPCRGRAAARRTSTRPARGPVHSGAVGAHRAHVERLDRPTVTVRSPASSDEHVPRPAVGGREPARARAAARRCKP